MVTEVSWQKEEPHLEVRSADKIDKREAPTVDSDGMVARYVNVFTVSLSCLSVSTSSYLRLLSENRQALQCLLTSIFEILTKIVALHSLFFYIFRHQFLFLS